MSERGQARTYVIGPLERRGLVLGLRAGHLVISVLAGLTVIAVVNVLPDVLGLVLAIAVVGVAAAVAFVPVGGRGLDEWALVAARHAWAHVLGATTWVSHDCLYGHELAPHPSGGGGDEVSRTGTDACADETLVRAVRRVDSRESTPPWLRRVELWAARWGDGDFGVVRDGDCDRWSAVLAVRGRSFALLDRSEKEARLDDWGRILASLARDNSALLRLQWLERTVPDDSESVVRDFARRRADEAESAAVRSYLALLDGAAPTTQQHELYLVLTVGGREAMRTHRCDRRLREQVISEALAHEIEGLARALDDCGLCVVGVLGLRPLAQLMRVQQDPTAEDGLAHRAAAGRAWTGAAPDDAYPQACAETWGELRVDGTHHRTYWVSEWPRCEVGADLMVPLLLSTSRRRTVSLVLAVDGPARAMRRVQAQRRGDETTESARERLGFTSGARRIREQEGAIRREQELASGHASLRFSAYITVSASSPAELDVGCADVERQARACGLEVRPEYGMQAAAFTYTLPLGRGLR